MVAVMLHERHALRPDDGRAPTEPGATVRRPASQTGTMRSPRSPSTSRETQALSRRLSARQSRRSIRLSSPESAWLPPSPGSWAFSGSARASSHYRSSGQLRRTTACRSISAGICSVRQSPTGRATGASTTSPRRPRSQPGSMPSPRSPATARATPARRSPHLELQVGGGSTAGTPQYTSGNFVRPGDGGQPGYHRRRQCHSWRRDGRLVRQLAIHSHAVEGQAQHHGRGDQ